MEHSNTQGPLRGVKVLEFGNFIAAPFLTRILADFGAEVIKIEVPGQGDNIRKWGSKTEGDKSVWWATQARNKKCITLNLKSEEGQHLAKKLVSKADVVVENLRPGSLDKLNLGYEDLKKINKKIIMARISGFGQTGTYSGKAGFGSVGEAMGGLRYVTGFPGQVPPRIGVSIGDSLAALYGALGTIMALFSQVKNNESEGQEIDVALYEAVFAVMENGIGEYYKYGVIKERTGSILPGVAPSNLYNTKDGKLVIVAANSDQLFIRLAQAIGHPEWLEDPKFNNHTARGKNQTELEDLIGEWVLQNDAQDVLNLMDEYGVPAGPVYNMEDISNDPHYHDREMIQAIEDPDMGTVHMPGIVPKLSKTPGKINWSGPSIGEHNEEIYTNLLELSEDELETYKANGVI
ncbi:crotonobetainyl-CoA:carnitine CoA-transferase CaiB-like acyl-CoA transferase [Lysinibacillus composti]|uniref:CoA transferase n=1 Tax=Lysinibacillus composti TaxID=720633 RepID=A0A3N9UFG3_9BACI|nr:CoA transferase [Lysinibacillus composti]MBM7608572.1 crotonobetainyl-CoA:carnitine CoA-transferase CaiB-like acyl-CoA transferase [Lysinibacillus composti]RQW74855.1 CoA transferase [Lysinibacillus composti]